MHKIVFPKELRAAEREDRYAMTGEPILAEHRVQLDMWLGLIDPGLLVEYAQALKARSRFWERNGYKSYRDLYADMYEDARCACYSHADPSARALVNSI